MAQVSRPVSPQSQYTSSPQMTTATPIIDHALSVSPVSPIRAPSPQTALPDSTTVGNASAQSANPVGSQRPTAATRRHIPEKTYQFLKTFASPSTHELGNYAALPVPTTIRQYDRHSQRWRLWNLVWLEWAFTVIVCVALFGLLYGYSKNSSALSTTKKRVFNALATGLSVALGLNLAGSLRSYVKILRWRLLATRYRSLTEFELILEAERLSSVFTLMWKARNARHRFLPSVTQFLCLLWILVNIAAAILVAMLGLTYNLNQSSLYDETENGMVSIVDFNDLLTYGYLDGLASANQFGENGLNYDVLHTLDQANETLGTYENVGENSRYWFTDYSPTDLSIALATFRYVDTFADCDAFPVTAGKYGNESIITYTAHGRSVIQKIPAAGQPGSGGMTFISDTAQTCGTRCTTVKAFQAETDPSEFGGPSQVTIAQFFICNSTVSQVNNIPSESYNDYLISDEIARMLAGAIGWTGQEVPQDTEQYQPYLESSLVAFYYATNATDTAQLISEFSIAAVANMDDIDNGNAPRQTIKGEEPLHADYLDVTWWHAGPLLVGLPCLQLACLLAIIAVGNRAVIKDDSFLSVAKLYKTTIDRLGDHGCMLRGNEIVEALRDPADGKEPEVIYAWRETGQDEHGMLGHIDVFDNKSGIACKPAFEEGRFDGTSGQIVASRSMKTKEKLKTD